MRKRWLMVMGLVSALGLGPQAQSSHRVVSLVPAVTEMVFALGMGDAVVGVSNYDHFPPAVESRAHVGALFDPDFERIISLRPDLVVVYETQLDLIQRLDRIHVPIFKYHHAGLADITATITTLGARLGRPSEAAREVQRIDTAIDATRRRVAGLPRPKTALLFGREYGSLRGIFASAGIGFMHDMLIAAGGDDAFGDVKRQSLQVSTEALIARRPETIIEVYPLQGWTTDKIASEIRVWDALPTLPAVRTHHVYILADDQLVVPGPRVPIAIELLARTLHPEAFRTQQASGFWPLAARSPIQLFSYSVIQLLQ